MAEAPDSLLANPKLGQMLRNDLPAPLYHQIFTYLRERIVSGDAPSGSRIPTEYQLAAAFAVSRITAKRALDELAAQGLVARKRGRGTHVIHQANPQSVPAPLDGLLQNLETLAESTDVHLVGFRRAVPPEPIRQRFGTGSAEELVNVTRVRSRDGLPFGHYVSWTRTRHPQFNAENLARYSRIRLFQRCRIRLAHVEQTLSAALADLVLADQLGVEPGSPLLTLERWSYNPGSELVDLLQIHYRPDRFRYRMTLDVDAASRPAARARRRR
jgi:GntR family transcriptional regulator